MTGPSPRARLLLSAVAVTALTVGATRLVDDGAADLRLPPDDPLRQLGERIDEQTGGDRLLALVSRDPDLFSPAGLQRLQAATNALRSTPGIARLASLADHSAPAVVDGTVTAAPLLPPPEQRAALSAARLAKLRAAAVADPFAVGALVSPDGQTAAVVGWLDDLDEDAAFVALVGRTLAEQPPPEQAAAVRRTLTDARLSVVLGQAEGPPDAAANRALRAMDGPAWLDAAAERAAALAADPGAVALAALQATELPEGWQVAGPAASEAVLAEDVPAATAEALAGLLAALAFGMALRRRAREAPRIAAMAGGAFGATLGAAGWLGGTLGPTLAAGGLAAGASAALVGMAGPVAALPLLGALAGAGAAGPVLALAALAAVLAVLGWAPERTEPPPIGGRGPAVALVVLGAALLSLSPWGLDASRLVGPRHPVGEATAWLADAGAAPSAAVVVTGEPGHALEPDSLAALRLGQDRLAAEPGVLGSASWADLLATLRGAVGGEATLPASRGEAEQLMLVFDRPEQTRPLVAPDKSLALARVRLAPGAGARLAALADAVPGLAGGGVEMAVAAARTARGMALGFLVAALLAVAIRRDLDAALLAAAAGLIAAGAAALWAGAVGPDAWVAAGVAAGAGLVRGERTLLAAAVGLCPVLLHPSLPGQGLAVGLAAAAAALSLHAVASR